MYANGDKYEGIFKDDKYDGLGTFTSSSGEISKGLWKEGIFIFESNLETENDYNSEQQFIEINYTDLSET
jgi:hypothetical protein